MDTPGCCQHVVEVPVLCYERYRSPVCFIHGDGMKRSLVGLIVAILWFAFVIACCLIALSRPGITSLFIIASLVGLSKPVNRICRKISGM